MKKQFNYNEKHYVDLKFDITYLNKMLECAEQSQELLSSLYWFNGLYNL